MGPGMKIEVAQDLLDHRVDLRLALPGQHNVFFCIHAGDRIVRLSEGGEDGLAQPRICLPFSVFVQAVVRRQNVQHAAGHAGDAADLVVPPLHIEQRLKSGALLPAEALQRTVDKHERKGKQQQKRGGEDNRH